MLNQILIVEDETEIAVSIIKFLEASGFSCEHVDDGSDVEPYLEKNHADLIVLDIMLPNKSGIEICKSIRKQSDIPIIMLTACSSELERLKGLEIGADDYVCKPFSAPELVLRVKAIMRRVYGEHNQAGLVISEDNFTIKYGQNKIDLTASEHGILKLLYDNPGKVYSRYTILDNIYSHFRVVTDRTVDSHVRNLRKKLKILSPERELIQAVYGAGYRYIERSTEE